MLGRIQQRLLDLYDLDQTSSVDDFVCDEEAARAAVGDDGVARREVLLVAHEPDGIAIGLYVDDEAVQALSTTAGDAWLDETRFDACCLATEGVSHFVYFVFRAENDHSVTQLELELQAEIDKYATALLAGNGVGLIHARSRWLRRKLFENVEFLDEAESEAGERYRLANRLASQYAARLESRYVVRGDLDALARELRRFYRLGAREKIETAGG